MSNVTATIASEVERLADRIHEARIGGTCPPDDVNILVAAAEELFQLQVVLTTKPHMILMVQDVVR